MKTPLTLLLCCFLVPCMLSAQDYLGDDLEFFQRKSERYQAWLDAKGLGEYLKVDEVRLQKNGYRLELFLSLRTFDLDTAVGMWNALETSHLSQPSQDKITDQLLSTFFRFMEIDPDQGNIQIYVPKKVGYGYYPCFYVFLWSDKGRYQIDAKTNLCKAQDIVVEVRKPSLRASDIGSSASIESEEEARMVFDKVLQYARNRYEIERCYGRFPRVGEEEISDFKLSFAVNDLCREVLIDERESYWCQAVQRIWGPCNDVRRERLEFELYYIKTQKGYTLRGFVRGKFGSGVYVPRRSGYMDMDPDFEEDYLKPYAKAFITDLRKYLESN